MKNIFYIILFFAFLHLFFGCSQPSNNQTSNQKNNPFINFLNIKEGQIAILDETYEPYFSQLQEREIYTFTGTKPEGKNINEIRSFAREKFASAVIPFSKEEKACITFVINEVQSI